MSAFAWNSHPFYLDQYENPFITYFDIVTLSISSTILAIAFTVWIYQLFLKNATNKAAMASKDAMKRSNESKDSKSSKKKPKIDMSLPTLTVAKNSPKTDKISDSVPEVPERSKTLSDPVSPSTSNEPQETERSAPSSPSSRSAPDSPYSQKSATGKHRDIHPLSKALVTISITVGMLFIWSLTAFCILCVVYHHPSCAILCIMFELLYTQRICLYCYYFHRLYLTFEKSVYAIDREKLIRNLSILCFWWVCGCVFFFIWCDPVGDCTELNVIISIIPLAVTELFISVYCVYSFVSKIKQLHVTKQEVRDKLQYLTSKLTILATFTVFSTFGVFSIYPFTFFLGLLAIDMPINVICLILTFGFYDKYYQKLCGPCRKYVEQQPQEKKNDIKANDEII